MGKKIIKLTESDLERIVRRVMNEDDGPTKSKSLILYPHTQEVYKDDNWTIGKLERIRFDSEDDFIFTKEALREYSSGTNWIFIMYLHSGNDKGLRDYLRRTGPTYFILPNNDEKSEKFLFQPKINYLVNSSGKNVDVSELDGGVAEFIQDKINYHNMDDLEESKKRTVKLTESQLVNIIERVIKEEYVYSIGELKKDLENMGLEVKVENEGGSQFVDDRFNDVIHQNNYRVTAMTSNDEEKLKVWEFISRKNTTNVKLGDNSISFGFSESHTG